MLSTPNSIAGTLDTAFADIVPDASDASHHYHRAAEEYAIECNIIKVIGSETYSSLTDEAIQIHGGYGYTEEFPAARAWRDQRLLRIGEGANEIVRLAIINTLLRRDKAGRLPLQAAMSQASRSLVDRSATVAADVEVEPLAAIGQAAENAKHVALFLLEQATVSLGADLMDAQEIVAAIADITCAAYALESVFLRCSLLTSMSHPKWAVALLTGQVASYDCVDASIAAARYCIDSLPCRFDRFEELLRIPANPMQLRRDLAAKVLAADGYPL